MTLHLRFLFLGIGMFLGSLAAYAASDLTLLNGSVAPGSVAIGSGVNVSFLIANNGNVASADSTPLVYLLSADTAFSPDDILLAGRKIGRVRPGVSNTVARVVGIPNSLSPGNYFILVIADTANINHEEHHANNKIAIPLTLTAVLPDYIIAYASLNGSSTGASVCAGEVIDARASVRDVSPQPAPASQVNFYLSRTQILDTSARLLAIHQVGAVGSYTNITTGQVLLTVPPTTASGSYYIIAQANAALPRVTENDTTNNLFSLPLSVTAPTLTAGAVTGGPFCAGQTLDLPLAISCGSLDSTNVFIVQISNGSGSFQNARAIALIPGSGAATLSVHLPVDLSTSTGYRLRVVTTTPALVSSNSTAFEVDALPVTPTVHDTARCGPGPLTLRASGAIAGQVYQWYTTLTGGTPIAGVDGPAFTTPALSQTTTYYVSISSTASLCASARVAVRAIVNTNHTLVVTPANPSICRGDSVRIRLSGDQTYSLTPDTGLITTTEPLIVASPAATRTYTVIGISDSGCHDTALLTITVNLVPATPVITSPGRDTVCEGDSVVLVSSPAERYVWSTGDTTQTVSLISTDNVSLVTESFAGCVSPRSDSVHVLLNPTPAAPRLLASGPLTFCQGDSVRLTAQGAAPFLFSTGDTAASLTVRQSGSYSVRAFTAAGCFSIASTTVAVTVNPIPTQPTITADSATRFCQGGRVTLTSSATTGNRWSTDDTTRSITVTTAGIYSLYAESAQACRSAASSVTVIVDPVPAVPSVTASGPVSFCQGDSVRLTASPSPGYLWSNGSTAPAITVSVSGTYSVRSHTAQGCLSAASDSVRITARLLPAAPLLTAGAALTFCEGDSVALTAQGRGSFLFSTGDTVSLLVVHGAGSYSVRVTDSTGCVSTPSDTLTVQVNPLPAAPAVTASGSTTFCQGDSVQLQGSALPGLVWSTGDTAQSITVRTTEVVTLRVRSAAGCLSHPSDSIYVTAISPGSAPTISPAGSLTLCAGDSLSLLSSASAGNLWSNGDTSQTIIVRDSGRFSVQVSRQGCLSAPSDSVRVRVAPLPAKPVIAVSGDLRFCAGGSVLLAAPLSASYLFSNGATVDSIRVDSSGSFSLQVGNAQGCLSPASDSVHVLRLPAVPRPTVTASTRLSFCPGDSVMLTSDATGHVLWSNGDTTSSIIVRNSGSYSVMQRDTATSCESLASVAVVVTVLPVPDTLHITAGGPLSFCRPDSVVLTASPAEHYRWSNGDSTQSIVAYRTGVYSVRAQNSFGCVSNSSDSVRVRSTGRAVAPTVTASGPLSFCAGDSLRLIASAGPALWSNGFRGDTIIIHQSGIYSAQVDSGGCLSLPSAADTVQINPKPAAGFTQAGDSLLATDTALGNQYRWTLNGMELADTTATLSITQSGLYRLTVTSATGCSDTSSQNVIYTSKRVTLSAGALRLSPNPSYGSVEVSVPTTGTVYVSLTDMLGAERFAATLISMSGKAMPLTLPVLPVGTYAVRVVDSSGRYWQSKLEVR